MNCPLNRSAIFGAALILALPCWADVILDETWADGSRNEQKLPAKSAWFASSSTNLTAAAGALTVYPGASSRQFITYFPVAGAPISLTKQGDSISATLVFKPSGVTDENPSRNLRLGLFDSSAGKKLTADGTPNGAGTKGYALFLNFSRSFGTPNAIQIGARNHAENTDLLGASAAYTPLPSTGQPANHSTGFTNSGVYTVQFSVKKIEANSVEIQTVVTGGGLSITNTARDSGPACATFDTFALRPSSVTGTAARFDISEFKIEGPKKD